MASSPDSTYTSVPDTLILKSDTDSPLELRHFAEGMADRYTGEEFQYQVDAPENTNFLLRIVQWFFETIAAFLEWLFEGLGIELTPELMKLMEIFVYFIFGGVALYFLIRFFSKESARSLFRKKDHVLPTVDLSDTHIETLDLNHLLDQALSAQNYRMAIRYHYLFALQQLSKQQKIQWEYDKTNSDYIRELAETGLKNAFQEVSYLYDHIWYGEQPINALVFKRAIKPFNHLKKELNG